MIISFVILFYLVHCVVSYVYIYTKNILVLVQFNHCGSP